MEAEIVEALSIFSPLVSIVIFVLLLIWLFSLRGHKKAMWIGSLMGVMYALVPIVWDALFYSSAGETGYFPIMMSLFFFPGLFSFLYFESLTKSIFVGALICSVLWGLFGTWIGFSISRRRKK